MRLVNLAGEAPQPRRCYVNVLSNVPALTTSSYNSDVPGYAVIDPVNGANFEVRGVGSVTADCPANHIVTVVAAPGKVFTATTPKLVTAISGLRVINATDIDIDVSINGGLRFGNLAPKANTGYMEIAGGSNGASARRFRPTTPCCHWAAVVVT